MQARATSAHPAEHLGSLCLHIANFGVFPGGKCVVVLWAALVDPEKTYTFQEGLLVVKWAQIHNHSLIAIPHRTSHTALQRVLAGGVELRPPAWLLPSQGPCEGWAETYPDQSHHTAVSSFAFLLTNLSSSIMIPTNQDCVIWSKLCKFGIFICIKLD